VLLAHALEKYLKRVVSTDERKYLDNQFILRKFFFWLIVSEILVHGCLAHCFGPIVAQKNMVGECGRERLYTSLHLGSKMKKKKRRGGGERVNPGS
jgi:hypothetical protein